MPTKAEIKSAWEDCLTYRRDQEQRSDEYYRMIDRYVITLSMAALGFSLYFARDMVPLDRAESLWMLPWSWCFFTASMVLVLCSQYLVPFTQRLETTDVFEQTENYVKGRAVQELPRRSRKINAWQVWIGRVGRLSFLAGMLLTLMFAIANLPSGAR